MAEEFFPQKRPMPSKAPPQAPQQMADLASRLAAMEEATEPQEKQLPFENVAARMNSGEMNPDGVQIRGNIPPQFQQALQERRQEAAASTMTMRKKSAPAINDVRVTGSNRLEELIAGIYNSSQIYEEVRLPSLGKFYNGEDGPTNGIVHLRPMTGEEEQILATPRFVRKGQAVNMIFNRCMREKFNSENFLVQDRTYLLIFLRGISYTPEYDVEVKCPLCDRRFGTTIDLNSLYLDYCPDDFSQDNLQDTLPTTGYKFTYKLAVGSDENLVQQYRDRKLKEFDTTGQADDTLIYRASMLITEIEGLTDKDEIKMLLKKLPVSDMSYIRTVVNEPPFGVDTKISLPCSGCNEEFEIDLPLEANFFFPKAKRKKTQA
jgi:hypothetical protein